VRLIDDVKVVNFVLARAQLLQYRDILASTPYGVDGHFELVRLVEELRQLRKWEAVSKEAVLDWLLRSGAGDLGLDGLVEKRWVLGDVLEGPAPWG
jgi:hypothetical protein